jgi:hypothetical protein
MSFDEQRKAEVDAKMARAREATAEAADEATEESAGILEGAKDKLRAVTDKARDAIHEATHRDN